MLQGLGDEHGLVFNCKGDGRTPNTLLFHTVMKFFGDRDAAEVPRGSQQDRFQAAAFEEYYTHGTPFHSDDQGASCLKAAERAGLDTQELRAFLQDAEKLNAKMRQVSQEAASLAQQINGVPFYIVDGKPLGSGATAMEGWREAFGL